MLKFFFALQDSEAGVLVPELFHSFCEGKNQLYEITKTVNYTMCKNKPVLAYISPDLFMRARAGDNNIGSKVNVCPDYETICNKLFSLACTIRARQIIEFSLSSNTLWVYYCLRVLRILATRGVVKTGNSLQSWKLSKKNKLNSVCFKLRKRLEEQ